MEIAGRSRPPRADAVLADPVVALGLVERALWMVGLVGIFGGPGPGVPYTAYGDDCDDAITTAI